MIRMVNEILMERDRIFDLRKSFFEQIIAVMSKAAMSPDKVLGQAETWSPFVNISSNNPAMGTLIIDFSVSEDEIHSYSLFHVGPVLRIGLLVPAWMEKAALAQDKDVTEFWRWKGEPAPIKSMSRGTKKLIEWTVHDENIYSSYLSQESIILGLRHLHFRLALDVFKTPLTEQNER